MQSLDGEFGNSHHGSPLPQTRRLHQIVHAPTAHGWILASSVTLKLVSTAFQYTVPNQICSAQMHTKCEERTKKQKQSSPWVSYLGGASAQADANELLRSVLQHGMVPLLADLATWQTPPSRSSHAHTKFSMQMRLTSSSHSRDIKSCNVNPGAQNRAPWTRDGRLFARTNDNLQRLAQMADHLKDHQQVLTPSPHHFNIEIAPRLKQKLIRPLRNVKFS